jgi:hypothetical protein
MLEHVAATVISDRITATMTLCTIVVSCTIVAFISVVAMLGIMAHRVA